MKKYECKTPAAIVVDTANHKIVEYSVFDSDNPTGLRVAFKDNCISIFREKTLLYDAILKGDRWYRESVFFAIVKTLIKRVQPIKKEITLECTSGRLAMCYQGIEHLNMNEVLYRTMRKERLDGRIWKKNFNLVGSHSFIKALIDIDEAVLLLSIFINSEQMGDVEPINVKIVEGVNIEEVWSD